MKKLLAIIFVGLYLLFNLGISFDIHKCQNGKVEFSMFAFLFDNSDKEITHNCCHHTPQQQSECECEDCFLLLDLSDDQISTFLSKEINKNKPTYFSRIWFVSINPPELVKEKIRINSPPPKPAVQTIISNQQLLFYA